MSYTYPPKCSLSHEKHIARFSTNMWSYISTPMTTGKRYLNYLDINGINRLKSPDEIYKANVKKAKKTERNISRLMQLGVVEPKNPIINPTSHQFEHFESNDYLGFWIKVISNYCNNIYFVDDWEYSSGCAYEFLTAKTHQIKCWSENLEELTLDIGIKKITQAIKESSEIIKVPFLEKVLNDLLYLHSSEQYIHECN